MSGYADIVFGVSFHGHTRTENHEEHTMIADRPADWARIIRERRLVLGMSQADLAAELGTSRQWLSNFENGHGTDTAQIHIVLRLLALLDLTAELTVDPDE